MTTSWISGPFLTARATVDGSRILDPLGLDAVGKSIVRRYLLPGITGGLQHARYFSFMTWILGSFEDANTRLPWRTFRRRVEHALRIAIKHADPDIRGLIGIDSTPSLTGAKSGAVQSIDTEAPSCFEAQYYGASFTAIGLAHQPRGSGPRLTDLGRTLFAAVEHEIEEMPLAVRSAARRLQLGGGELTVTELGRLAEFFQLRKVEPNETEYAPLLMAVWGLESSGERSEGDALQRSQVFALVLSLLGSRAVEIANSGQLLATLWGPLMPDAMQGSFPAEVAAWRCFGERQAQRIAIGGIWSVIHEWMKTEAPFAIAVETLVNRGVHLLPDPQGSSSSVRPCANQSWGAFEDAIGRKAGTTREARFEYRQSLMAELEARGAISLPTEERIECALQLMALLAAAWRIEERAGDDFAYELHTYGGEGRMCLGWFAEQLSVMRKESVGSVLSWLIERCVLDQLQRVGYAKGPGTSKLLLVREESAVLLVREGAAVRPFAQDANRLNAVMALLEGMSLIELVGDRFTTSVAGDELLVDVARHGKRN